MVTHLLCDDAANCGVLHWGVLLEHETSGVLQYVDKAGLPVASVFGSRPIDARAHVDLVVDGTEGMTWWTEVTVPYGDMTRGARLAQAIAGACGGRIAMGV